MHLSYGEVSKKFPSVQTLYITPLTILSQAFFYTQTTTSSYVFLAKTFTVYNARTDDVIQYLPIETFVGLSQRSCLPILVELAQH